MELNTNDIYKRLKDAGFPQGATDWGVCMDDEKQEVVSKNTHSVMPTLEELFEEARGKLDNTFFVDSYQKGTDDLGSGWIATGAGKEFFGRTVFLAVAELYIYLNKKEYEK